MTGQTLYVNGEFEPATSQAQAGRHKKLLLEVG